MYTLNIHTDAYAVYMLNVYAGMQNLYANLYARYTLNVYVEHMCNVYGSKAVSVHTEFSFLLAVGRLYQLLEANSCRRTIQTCTRLVTINEKW